MQQADVLVYDRLVSPEILDLARRDSEKVYVGKQRQHHALPQESINILLADLAKAGKRVASLKGGDPFIFGRGGEEIETLMQQGYPFPGGAGNYRGIRLRHLCRHPSHSPGSCAVLHILSQVISKTALSI